MSPYAWSNIVLTLFAMLIIIHSTTVDYTDVVICSHAHSLCACVCTCMYIAVSFDYTLLVQSQNSGTIHLQSI